MAKRRSSSSRKIRRDAPVVATRRVSDRRSAFPPRVSLPRRPPYVSPSTDDRFFSPDRGPLRRRSSYNTISGRPARVVPPPVQKRPLPRSRPIPAASYPALHEVFQSVPAQLLFAQPNKALACIRRSVRRQVLAATRRLGANRYRKPSNPIRC